MNHGVAVLLEVEALLTDRVVASTNSQKGELNASRATRSARVARSFTRAAAPTPCNGAPGGRPARTVAMLCPTRLPMPQALMGWSFIIQLHTSRLWTCCSTM